MDRPEFFIVPSRAVARYVKKNHAEWLVTPGRKGQKHNDTTMRNFRDDKGRFLEAWGNLGLDV